ncbi:hypothetical protein [Paenibacillus sedimenti]|uniref:Uncharacterized protein n=1 Tax=Paenibacillus sedimenti TaxID=2770274 RepID=A0A926KYV5_9BACL|nr:hypothetical protein [Paenibacillus sedimenti]MBD0384758.1 hypothetical protein [Paenibacillus sedimenti]
MNLENFLSKIRFKHAYKAFTREYPVLYYTFVFQGNGSQTQEINIEFKYDEFEKRLIRPLSYAHGEPLGVDCPLCGRWTGTERDYTRCKIVGDLKYDLLSYINQQAELDLVPSKIKTLSEIQSE